MSELAQRVAGIYVEPAPRDYAPVAAWVLRECLEGALAEGVRRFCAEQPEYLDPANLEITGLTAHAIQCSIRCRQSDHESRRTFLHEVRFEIDPTTAWCRRAGH